MVAALALALAGGLSPRAAAIPQPSALNQLPLFFEPANTPAGSTQQFLARGGRYEFLLTPSEVRFVLARSEPAEPSGVRRDERPVHRDVVLRAARMKFVGARSGSRLLGAQELPAKINYLTGNDPARWQAGLSTYAKVRLQDLYPGISACFYGNQQQLEYDFLVAPHADPGAIVLQFEGLDGLAVDPAGNLVLTLGDGALTEPRPLAYQMLHGVAHPVSVEYRLQDSKTVTLALGHYDPEQPLVIDPVFSYSTYFGGNDQDSAFAIKVDATGAVYITGETLSTKFLFTPPADAFQRTFQGGTYSGDAFVAKLDSTGSVLVYYTYLGGSGEDGATDLALDSAGNVYLTGFTSSPDFPTKNPMFGHIGGVLDPIANAYPDDAFVAELNTNGSALVFSTFLGAENNDVGAGIALDPAGDIFVTGVTSSTNFPVVAAFQKHFGGFNDAFVAKFARGGTRLLYCTYLGGAVGDKGEGIAADETGAAYITGLTSSQNFPVADSYQGFLRGSHDVFVTKLQPSGALDYSTYLGGTNDDYGYRIAVDSGHNAYVTGTTLSPRFPQLGHVAGLFQGSTPGDTNYDAFLTKFGPHGGLLFSTLFGGTNDDAGWDVAVDPAGRVFVIGITTSHNFPVVNAGPALHTANYGGRDVFLTAFNTNLTAALYSGYLGGSTKDLGYGVAVDAEGNAYITGVTTSTNFPTFHPFQPTLRGIRNGFIAKLRMAPPALNVQRVDGTVVLQWPATAPDYALQFAPTLLSPIPWAPVPEAPVLSQGVYSLTLGLTNTADIFRLYRTY